MSKRIKLEYDIPSEYYWYYNPHFYEFTQKSIRRDEPGSGFASWGIRWIYALLLLIVIVLQFGRKPNLEYRSRPKYSECDGCEFYHPEGGSYDYNPESGQLIDNSVLFIIVVFLLILCTGCWWGDNYK